MAKRKKQRSMVAFVHFLVLAYGVFFHVNEASDVHEVNVKKVLSKQEIMANLTDELAVNTVLGMRRTQDHPEFMELLRTQFGRGVGATQHHASLIIARSSLRGSSEPGGNALDKATGMLNSMIEETQGGLEAENFRCSEFDRKTTRALDSMRTAVSNFNAAAASARGEVIKAQGQIGTITANLVQTEEDFERHKQECTEEKAELNSQLKVVEADIQVMATILKFTDCEGSAEGSGSKLIQCRHCNEQYMITHGPIQQMLGKLRSRIARQFIQNRLEVSFHESLNGSKPVALTQEDIQRMLRNHEDPQQQKADCVDVTGRYMFGQGGGDEGAVVTLTQTGCSGQATGADSWTYSVSGSAVTMNGRGVTGTVNLLNGSVATIVWSNGITYNQFSKLPDVPSPPAHFDCQPTNKCSLSSNPNCQKLKDRFLNVQAGIVDKRNELEETLAAKQTYCEETTEQYTHQIDGMNTRLREQQAALAVGTQEQNQAETGSRQKSEQHESTSKEYTQEMAKCCDNKNQAKSEICALEKIRGELQKMEGKNLWMVDCDVSDWREEECSVTCGGGTRRKVRTVIVQPQGGGTHCPPLEATEPCNDDPCPIDCQVGDWSGWSACSAECGGGVIERSRDIQRQPAHGGEPCEETEDTMACNIQTCDVDCVLNDWSDWGSCSRACASGSEKRVRSIATPAHGQGHCAEPTDGSRLGFKTCNAIDCYTLIPQGRELLHCNSRVDVVILVDGSASLGQEGWQWTMDATGKLVGALTGGQIDVQVALQVFSGPESWDMFEACTGGNTSAAQGQLDMAKDCGITWVSHLTDSTTDLAQGLAASVEYPKESTLTSVALGQAESELLRGRSDANSVVVVITDGYPMSEENTKVAARKLSSKAKVLWVPVTESAPFELIDEVAGLPKEEHIIQASYFQSLSTPWVLNRIIASICPTVS